MSSTKDIEDARDDPVQALRNFPSLAIFLNGGLCQARSESCTRVAWSRAVVADLQIKVEKYEAKAAQCQERVQEITDGPQRAFYEVLAHYYGKLATDFRQILEKRKTG